MHPGADELGRVYQGELLINSGVERFALWPLLGWRNQEGVSRQSYYLWPFIYKKTTGLDTPAPLEDIIRMASLTPAERAGVARSVGSLEVGKHADVLILDQKLQVKRVFVHGFSAL